MSLSIATNITPGTLPNSAGQVASLSGLVALHGTTWIAEADANVTGTSGSNVFMRITETVSSTVIATSQIQLSSAAAGFASARCIGLYTVPGGSTASLAFMLEMWTDGSVSVGTGSGIFKYYVGHLPVAGDWVG